MSEDQKNNQPDHQWYLPNANGTEPEGPFSFTEVVAQVKSGKIRSDSFIWGSHFKDSKWHRIIDREEFASQFAVAPKIAVPKKMSRGRVEQARAPVLEFRTEGEYGVQNIYRRYPRVPVVVEIIAHDQSRYFKGLGVDVSEKGIFIQLDNMQAFQKGDEITVTIRGNSEIGSFSATGVVLRVIPEGTEKGFGIYFLRINPLAKRRIARYVLKKLSEAGEVKSA